MADLSVGRRKAKELDCAERFLIELDRISGATND
jgi:hypothetical protein